MDRAKLKKHWLKIARQSMDAQNKNAITEHSPVSVSRKRKADSSLEPDDRVMQEAFKLLQLERRRKQGKVDGKNIREREHSQEPGILQPIDAVNGGMNKSGE